jgi:hypothetical protein
MSDYLTAAKQVARERVTTAKLQKMDTADIVDLVHGLEDQIASLQAKVEAAEAFEAERHAAPDLARSTHGDAHDWRRRDPNFCAQVDAALRRLQP